MSFTLRGGKELEATMALATKQGPDVAAASLTRLAEQIIADAVMLAPVDTGALRASGHVDPAVANPHEVSVSFGFNAEYALVQHERTDFHHKVGQAKYLETPMKARAPELAGIFRRHLDEFAAQWKQGRALSADMIKRLTGGASATG